MDTQIPQYAQPGLRKKAFSDGELISEWRSPSNIALVKYWGKHDNQLPSNASISLTLSHSHTTTRVAVRKSKGRAGLSFYFDGKEEPAFKERMQRTLSGWSGCFSFLNETDIRIESANSFPHSAGIASSASAMSALALCFVDLERQLGSNIDDNDFLRKASYVARLGSGSAARSLFPLAAGWGKISNLPGSNAEAAIELPAIAEVFRSMQDAILIVDPGKKSVSSSAGHSLMDRHPFARARFAQADRHASEMVEVLASGEMERFIQITEAEALTLHGLMMSSDPGFILMRSGTLEIIQRIRKFREQSGLPVCFTLDAGPNVHLLYPASIQEEVKVLITNELMSYCEERKVIFDEVGDGPVQIN